MRRQGDTYRSLPRPARRYIAALGACAIAGVLLATVAGWTPPADPALLVLVASLCAAGSTFQILAPGRYALHPNYAAFVWGALLLPPWAVPVLAVACFAPDWLSRQVPTYKVVFNILNNVLVGLVMNGIAGAAGLAGDPHDLALSAAAGGLCAALAGAVLNHLLIVLVIALAGEQPLRATIPQLTDGLPLSIGVGLTGVVLAVLWNDAPALLLLASGPMALVYRALWVPMLRHQAATDAKTGLYNSERFREELTAQLEGVTRSRGRLAVAMIDLDHLRAINTRCGHLAGDRAIRAVADELADLASRHGAAGRFGGEEFSLVLPGFDAHDAHAALDEIRVRVGAATFREGGPDELRVTFSAGVAVFPAHGRSVDQLLAAADAALYDAKAAGRDRVRIALSAASRELLHAPLEAAAEQPLPAVSAVGGRLTGVGRAALRRMPRRRAGERPGAARPGDELRRMRNEIADTRELLGRMQRSSLQTILTLARSIEDKDPFRAGSTDRVAAVSMRLAAELGWHGLESRALELGAALRGIGRVGVRDAVLLKDGALDPLERDELRRHTDLAGRVLADLELPVAIKHMVRSHHERWDGTGYPDGLAGEEIPPAARVLAVADALDAMLSARPHRPAMQVAAAYAEIAAGAGSQFCPAVVAALERCSGGDPAWVANVAVHPSSTPAEPLRDEPAGPIMDAAAGTSGAPPLHARRP